MLASAIQSIIPESKHHDLTEAVRTVAVDDIANDRRLKLSDGLGVIISETANTTEKTIAAL